MKEQLYRQFAGFFRFEPFPWVVPLIHQLPNEQVLTKGCIVDLETTGLYPNTDMIVTLGIIKGKDVFLYQLTNNQYDRFWGLCVNIVSRMPKPRYGYNARFEAEFLRIEDGWKDLTQFGERDYDDYERGPYYCLRLEDATLPPFKDQPIKSCDVPSYWKQWLETKQPKTLYEITFHNLTDLLRTLQLIRG